MITPFTEAGEIDYEVLEATTEWYIASGCSGLFAVCQSSEMYTLVRHSCGSRCSAPQDC